MIYKVPFTALTRALYKTLSGQGLEWFDSAVPIHEIEDYFMKQTEFAYGILGAAEADARETKTAPVWSMILNLEIYSNYKGRKVVAEKLEELFNFLSSEAGWKALAENIQDEGFSLSDITVGALSISLPIVGDYGTWQNGGTTLKIRVSQNQ